MKILFLYFLLLTSTFAIKKFTYGKWRLRYTNDPKLNGESFLIFKDDNSMKFKTITTQGIITIKFSRTGEIKIIKLNKNKNKFNANILFSQKTSYFYSLFGIKIPDLKRKHDFSYEKNKLFNCEIMNNSLFVKDIKNNYIYLFDLDLSSNENRFVEISFEYFIFTQILSILLGYLSNNHTLN
jgi:hypothetical protein